MGSDSVEREIKLPIIPVVFLIMLNNINKGLLKCRVKRLVKWQLIVPGA
ncbi:hypothetical protein KAR34_12535 [bacterium]|nr:hypothetical protein [bacterium]